MNPRGYFGKTKFYGDKDYDWAKVYYSLAGNYDQFNQKKFALSIGDKSVELVHQAQQLGRYGGVLFRESQKTSTAPRSGPCTR